LISPPRYFLDIYAIIDEPIIDTAFDITPQLIWRFRRHCWLHDFDWLPFSFLHIDFFSSIFHFTPPFSLFSAAFADDSRHAAELRLSPALLIFLIIDFHADCFQISAFEAMIRHYRRRRCLSFSDSSRWFSASPRYRMPFSIFFAIFALPMHCRQLPPPAFYGWRLRRQFLSPFHFSRPAAIRHCRFAADSFADSQPPISFSDFLADAFRHFMIRCFSLIDYFISIISP